MEEHYQLTPIQIVLGLATLSLLLSPLIAVAGWIFGSDIVLRIGVVLIVWPIATVLVFRTMSMILRFVTWLAN